MTYGTIFQAFCIRLFNFVIGTHHWVVDVNDSKKWGKSFFFLNENIYHSTKIHRNYFYPKLYRRAQNVGTVTAACTTCIKTEPRHELSNTVVLM